MAVDHGSALGVAFRHCWQELPYIAQSRRQQAKPAGITPCEAGAGFQSSSGSQLKAGTTLRRAGAARPSAAEKP